MDGSTLASRSASVPEVPQRPARRFSPWLDAWRRFRRHRLAFASGIVLLAMILAIAFGPFVWKVAINDIDFAARMQTPSWKHPFGTDDLGQDLLARMLYGGRISLAVGLSAMFVAITVGTIIGAIAGMARGWVGPALMWLTDLFLSLPELPLLLLIIYLFRDALTKWSVLKWVSSSSSSRSSAASAGCPSPAWSARSSFHFARRNSSKPHAPSARHGPAS